MSTPHAVFVVTIDTNDGWYKLQNGLKIINSYYTTDVSEEYF